MTLRTLSIGLSAAVLLGIVAVLGHIGGTVVFDCFLLFCGFPPIVSIIISIRSKNPFSQLILAAASLLYGVWFVYTVYGVFCVSTDPQSALIILVVGFDFLPVLLPLWITACIVEKCHRKKKPKSPNGTLNCSPRRVELYCKRE